MMPIIKLVVERACRRGLPPCGGTKHRGEQK